MISFLISLIPFSMICYYFIYLKVSGGAKGYVSNLGDKKRGQNCYECYTELNSEIDYTKLDKCDPKLCLSCERDRVVKSLFNPFKSKIYKFDKFFFTKNFEKYIFGLLIISIAVVFTSATLSLALDLKVSSIPGNLLLGLYWLLMLYRVKIANKKSSQ
jgi:hypothetical protein